MNTKTNITHKYSYLLTVNVKPRYQTITQFTKIRFSYQLFVIGAVMAATRGVAVAEPIRGTDEGETLPGTAGDDIILGFAGIDIIDGLAGDDTIDGGAGNDEIYGGLGHDTIYGDAGNDEIYGNAGNDEIYGGLGHDTILDGGAGNDDIYGGEGIDYIYGRLGIDTLYGGAGDDHIYGGEDKDTIDGGDGIDTISGGAGDDYIRGGADGDTISGGEGIDTILGGDGDDIIDGGTEDDWIYGGAGDDDIYGGDGYDYIYGGVGDDIIQGGAGDDSIFYNKGDGNDTIYGGAGDNDRLILVGFVEDDVLSFERTGATGDHLTLNFKDTPEGEDGGSITLKYSINSDEQGIDKIVFDINNNGIEDTGDIIWEDHQFVDYIVASNIPYTNIIHVRAGGDNIVGGTGDNRIFYNKGDGDRTIEVGDGDDELILLGFGVEDILSIERTGDHLTLNFKPTSQGEDGGSIILKDSFNDTDAGIDKIVFDANLNGEDDTDTIWLDDNASFEGNIADSNIHYTIHGNDGNDIIYSGEDADTIYGGDGDDTIFYNKGDGNDTIDGGAGNDTLILVGFVEDDVLSIERRGLDLKLNFKPTSQGEDGGSIILIDSFNNTDAGIDKIVFDTNSNGIQNAGEIVWLDDNASFEYYIAASNIHYIIHGTAEIEQIFGSAGNDFIYGYAGADNIYGYAGIDTIYGGEGNDIIQGGEGNDIIYGGAGNDEILDGGAGDDTIYGGAGDDTIYGGVGIDTIYGSEDADTIYGGAGNDTIFYNKGDGNDTLYGGDGDDWFSHSQGEDNGEDVLILVGFDEDDILSFERTGATGDDLTLTFKDTPEGEDGGSITLKYSFDTGAAGIDKIVFDTNENGQDPTDIIWEDHEFESHLLYFIDGGAPIADVTATTGTVLIDTPEDDTYLINYISGSGTIDLQVIEGAGGASGYDTVIIQGYSGAYFYPRFTGSDIILISPSRGSYPDIKFTFANDDIFERFVFDKNANGLIEGNDFTWLTGKRYVNNVIEGTDVRDYIYGSGGDDIISGGAGRDLLHGFFGDDTIYGGDGDDYIGGSDGDDILYGNDGNDEIWGDEGDDIIDGGAGDDTIYVGYGNDTIFYNNGDGNDTIYSGDGEDVLILVGFVEDDLLSIERTGQDLKLNFKDTPEGEDGGSIILKDSFNNNAAGIDKIVFDIDADEIINEQTDIIWLDDNASFEYYIATSNIPYTIYGGDGDDTIRGTDGNDIIYGGTGDDTIYGGTGDNRIVYNKGDGHDTIEVGDGEDVLILVGFVEDDVLSIERTEQDLKLIFKDTPEGEDGGSITLIDTINGDATGIDKIVFDTNADRIEDTGEIVWNDNGFFVDYIVASNIPYTNIIHGTDGIDIIWGTAGDDTIYGYAGNDEIWGGAGDDILYGGAGNDIIWGFAGDDTIYGGTGNDEIYGIYGPTGNNRIVYNKGDGDDTIEVGDGVDTLILVEFVVGDISSIERTDDDLKLIFEESAGGGSIILKYSINDDARGIDKIFFDTDNDGIQNAGDIIWDDDGFFVDYIAASNILYIIHGTDGNDIIYSGVGNDHIYGGTGNNRIVYNKGDGDDTIEVGDGEDVLILAGFVEDDVLSIERTGQDLKLIFKDSSQGGSIILKDSFYDDARGIDKIVFDTDSNGEDTGDIIWEDHEFVSHLLTFIDGSAPIATVGRIDVIALYNLNPGTPLVLTNTPGDDTYLIDYDQFMGSSDDIIDLQVNPFDGDGGASGFDTAIIQGYSGGYFSPRYTGSDIILISPRGGLYPDIKFTFANDDIFERFVFDENNNNLIDGSDFTWLIGSQNANSEIKGTDVRDRIYGGAGDDIILGYAGDDIILGYAGDDRIEGGAGNDSIWGYAGNDTIYGGDGIDWILGGYGNDDIYGGDGDDTIVGEVGDDTIYGGLGNDTIYGKGEDDEIYGGYGNDDIYGGDGNDILKGGDGDDTISGGDGNDTIFYNKGDGDDTIYDTIYDNGWGSGWFFREYREGVLILEDVLILVGFVEDDVLSFERTDDDLKLNFTNTALGEDGGSIILKDSFNDDEQGIDKIVFDTNRSGSEDTGDTIWEDHQFADFIDGA